MIKNMFLFLLKMTRDFMSFSVAHILWHKYVGATNIAIMFFLLWGGGYVQVQHGPTNHKDLATALQKTHEIHIRTVIANAPTE